MSRIVAAAVLAFAVALWFSAPRPAAGSERRADRGREKVRGQRKAVKAKTATHKQGAAKEVGLERAQEVANPHGLTGIERAEAKQAVRGRPEGQKERRRGR